MDILADPRYNVDQSIYSWSQGNQWTLPSDVWVSASVQAAARWACLSTDQKTRVLTRAVNYHRPNELYTINRETMMRLPACTVNMSSDRAADLNKLGSSQKNEYLTKLFAEIELPALPSLPKGTVTLPRDKPVTKPTTEVTDKDVLARIHAKPLGVKFTTEFLPAAAAAFAIAGLLTGGMSHIGAAILAGGIYAFETLDVSKTNGTLTEGNVSKLKVIQQRWTSKWQDALATFVNESDPKWMQEKDVAYLLRQAWLAPNHPKVIAYARSHPSFNMWVGFEENHG